MLKYLVKVAMATAVRTAVRIVTSTVVKRTTNNYMNK